MDDVVASPSRFPDSPSLVGRVPERAALSEALNDAAAGQGRLVVIGGAAGIGKTTLVRDVIREARMRDVLVLTGHCYDLTNTPPYGPWLDLLIAYQPGDRLPSPPAFASGRLEGITSQAALFAEMRSFLGSVANVRPALVILEDLHWADPASLELLRHVAGHIDELPLLLIVTYRVDELTRRHPFYQHLPALIRESGGERLNLRRLDTDELRALVRSQWRLDSANEGRLTDYIERHAEGNPFFATELLRALKDEGILRARPGEGALGELDRVIVPPLLRQVIDGRVGRMGEEMRIPLAMAAVIGQEAPLDLWAEVGEIGEEALLAIVEEAVEAHLMEAERDGTRVRFVHALTREALYEGVLPPRRRLWHRRAAEALMARPDADPDGIAFHLQEAGDARAAEWLMRAGERAQRAYAWRTASERFTTAADLLAGVAGEERTRAQILCRLARLLRFANPEEGLPGVEEAIRLAESIGDAALAAEARQTRGVLRCYTNDYTHGREDMEAGTAALEALAASGIRKTVDSEIWLADALPVHPLVEDGDDGVAHAALASAGMHHLRGIRGSLLAYAGGYREALAIGERLLTVAGDSDRTGPLVRVARAHAIHGIAVAQAALGRVAEAERAFALAVGAYHELDHHAGVAFALLNELHMLTMPFQARDPNRRSRLAAEAEAALRRAAGALNPSLSPRLGRVACLLLDGAWDTVRDILREGAEPDNSLLRREVTGVAATLAHHEGRPAQAWARVRDLLPGGPATPPGSRIFPEALQLQRLAADLALDAGDLPAARSWLEAHDRWLAWNGALLGRADGLIGWARYHDRAGDRERAHSCAAAALAEAAAPEQPLVLLTAHRLLGRMATADRDWNYAESHLQSARELAGSCAVPFMQAEVLIALAELRLAEGQRGAAVPLLDEAVSIATVLGAVPMRTAAETLSAQAARAPGGAPEFPAGLTQREVEVLRLVAQGLTDGAVGERLFISARTVSQHLRSIYGKLDVSSRAAATRVAVEQGLV